MTQSFKSISDLNIGAVDAVNYSGRQEKEFLAKIFLRDSVLDRVLARKRYFLVGEKGTGKTAYATLLSNMEYHETASEVRGVTATDYTKFIRLKQLGHLQFSSYVDVWKTILLLLMSDHLKRSEASAIPASLKFQQLNQVIEEYYKSAFSPEVVNAIEFVENAEVTAELLSKIAKIGAKEAQSVKLVGSGFQTSLMSVEKKFKDAIESLRLKKDHILFIDGIDVRPSDVDYETYIECIRGLALAVWSLNVDYFSNVKDSKGRIKVVLLLRPDIFDQIGFQNANAKMRDNSVVLDWKTTYADFRTSRMFRLIDGLLGKQQDGGAALPLGAGWSHYFSYDLPNMRVAEKVDDPFISFLRYSFYRPRDIISYLMIMQEYVVQHRPEATSFRDDDFRACQSLYSDYLLGEVKDHLSFYHSEANFDELVGFFKFLGGRSHFDWDEFLRAYGEYRKSNAHKKLTIKEVEEGPEAFLQLLYSINVVGYDESSTDKLQNFVHWCFRDRTAVTLNPKIPTGTGQAGVHRYSIHPGLARSLRVGATTDQ